MCAYSRRVDIYSVINMCVHPSFTKDESERYSSPILSLMFSNRFSTVTKVSNRKFRFVLVGAPLQFK